VQRIRDGRTGRILGGRTIWRSGDPVCGLHHAREDEERVFLGWALKLRSMVCHLFDLKTTGKVFSGLASKSVATISPVWPQNWWRLFLWFGLKIGGDGFLVELQNQGGGGFPSLTLKTGSYGLVICASKSPRRFLSLGLKTKQGSVCRLRHKIDGRM
jgi:hypothetical protein